MTITSRVLQQIADQLRAGRHPLVAGNVGDLALVQGDVHPFGRALETLACSAFGLVVRVNAASEVTVVRGDEHLGEISRDDDVDGDEDGERPERERRLAALRRRGRGGEDPFVLVRDCLTQNEVGAAVILEQADILLQDPAHHDEVDRGRVARLQLALRDAVRVGRYRNTCFLLAGDGTAVPLILLAGFDDVARVDVAAPNRAERGAYLATVLDTMHGTAHLDVAARAEIVAALVQQTDGESLRTLESLAAYSAASRIPATEARRLVNRHRHGDRPDYWSSLLPAINECHDLLESRVFGQDQAVDAALGVLAAGALGLRLTGDEYSAEGQPRGILWFVGPTGVGKTELAKAIAEAVFGDAEAYVRLDMSTFAQEHAAERLMGSPPGYVGFEQGGELTNAVRRRPNSVILLDEIEKAHPRVLDRFMSIFDDGRVTDAQGRVTYFGETIIVATSNLGSTDVARLMEERGDDVTFEEIRDVSLRAVRDHFTTIARPEIFGRISAGIVPFDVLRTEVVDRIAEKIVTAASFANGPILDVDVPSACRLAQSILADPTERVLGGRRVREVLLESFRELSVWLALNGHGFASRVSVRFAEGAMLAAVDGRPEVPVGPAA